MGYPTKNQQDANRAYGKSWEKILEARARSNGLLILHSGLTAQFIGGGGVRAIKSDLDYRLFMRSDPHTRIAVFDAKCFDAAYVDFSQFTEHQLERARLYEDWGVPSGFVCWLRQAPALEQVVFYSAPALLSKGPGTRFQPSDGLRLGSVADFDLRAILGV